MEMKPLNIVLVNPRCDPRGLMGRHEDTMVPIPPLGVACIAAVLSRDGHNVSVLDQYAEKLDNAGTVLRIAGLRPHLVGFSCLTPAMATVKDLARKLRGALPGVKIVLGNIHASVFAEALIEQGVCDFVVHGEGENAVSGLARALSRDEMPLNVPGISLLENGKPVFTGPPVQVADLDSLPYPAWHLMPVSAYRAHPISGVSGILLPVQAGRGCPHRCAFCSQNAMFKGVRARRIESVVDEIEHLADHYGLSQFGFEDSIFPLTKADGLAFCEEMRRRGLHRRLQWFTEIRVDMADLELFRAMKEAGLVMLLFGIESADEKILAHCGKTITPEQSRRAVELAKKARLRTLGLYILGLPGETRESAWKTIRFALEVDTDFAKFNIAVPYPGSPFFENWRKGRGEDLDYHKFTSWFLPRKGEHLLHVPDGMSQEELLWFQQAAMAGFWLRPSKILRHLAKGTISPSVMWKGFRALLGGVYDSARRI